MSSYSIKSWNPILGGNNCLVHYPSIYVEPDMAFLEFVRNNNFRVACKISGTNTLHDGQTYMANINQSSNFPNCRPNFFVKTGLYIVTMEAPWTGYPDPNMQGSVEFFGINE